MAVILYLKVKYIWEKYFFYKSNWEGSTLISNLYINLAWVSVCLFWCLSVCLYPINVKTAEPIGPKFFVGHLGAPGKAYEWLKFQIFVFIKIRSSLNFLKFWKSTKFLWKSANYFCFVLRCTQREHCSELI